MTFPDFTEAVAIPFGSWIGNIPIYVLTTDSSGTELPLVKTELELVITLSAVDNNHTSIVKISFQNSDLGISNDVLSYNQKCFLYFNQLSIISIIPGSEIQFDVNGNIEFIEDEKLKLSLAGSGFMNGAQSSIAAQCVFIPLVSPV
jgi:hypothetical protein